MTTPRFSRLRRARVHAHNVVKTAGLNVARLPSRNRGKTSRVNVALRLEQQRNHGARRLDPQSASLKNGILTVRSPRQRFRLETFRMKMWRLDGHRGRDLRQVAD